MGGTSGTEFDFGINHEPSRTAYSDRDSRGRGRLSGCGLGLVGCVTAPIAAVALVAAGFGAGMYVQKEFLTEKPENKITALEIKSEGMHPARKEIFFENTITYKERGVHQRMRGWLRDRSSFVDWVASLGDSEVDMEMVGNCGAGVDHLLYPPIYDANREKGTVTATIGPADVFGCSFESPESGQKRNTGMRFESRGGILNAPPEIYSLLTDYGIDALIQEAKRQRMDDEATKRARDEEYAKLEALGYTNITVNNYQRRRPEDAPRPIASPMPAQKPGATATPRRR